eukprot:403369588
MQKPIIKQQTIMTQISLKSSVICEEQSLPGNIAQIITENTAPIIDQADYLESFIYILRFQLPL